MKIIQPLIEILTPIDGDYILKFLEQCGRTCYKSEDKITEDSAEKFVRALIKSGHESVIEHFNITVKVICNRGISHEIVRHRIGAYSQESTRYVNYKDGIEVILPNYLIMPNDKVYEVWLNAMADAERHYKKMIALGARPEIARDVLPNALKTEVVITYNLRQWRHFFKQRLSRAAHPQIRQIAGMILREFKEQIPVIFEDIGGKENAG